MFCPLLFVRDWLIAFLSCCLGSFPFGFAEGGFCCYWCAFFDQKELVQNLLWDLGDWTGTYLILNLDRPLNFFYRTENPLSSTGELWNLRVSCHSVGEDEEGVTLIHKLPSSGSR
jgi:hypothetical protein